MSVLRWFLAPPEGTESAESATSRAAPPRAPLPAPAFAPPVPPRVARGLRRAPGTAPRSARDTAVSTGAATEGDTVVLALAADVELAAGGAVARLRGVGGSSVACLWTPEEGEDPYPAGPCLPSAARAARRLAARGLAASALGAVVRVPLAVEPVRALAQVRDVRAAVGRPVAIALTRRDPSLDVLLEEGGEVLVMSLGDPVMTELVRERAACVNPAAVIVDRPLSPIGRLSHRLGLASPAAPADRPGAGRRRPSSSSNGAASDAGAEVLH